MASDLAAGPRTDLRVELCGDAHLGNFRLYLSPERRLVFDLNDFDETLPGPFEWDVKRLAASITVAARHNGHSKGQIRRATRDAMRTYRELLAKAAGLNPLDLHYYRFESDELIRRTRKLGKRRREQVEKILEKATKKNSLRAMAKYTAKVDGRRVIVPDPPLIVPLEEEMSLEVANGIVGTRCLMVLLEAGDGTPSFLDEYFKYLDKGAFPPIHNESLLLNRPG